MKSIREITEKIIERSKSSRERYLQNVEDMRNQQPAPDRLSCSNWAHVVAASSKSEKTDLPSGKAQNIALVTAYNDMLSAHQPFATYPNLIKLKARELGATAQVAGGVPAMCDGVTQGQPGMELSLFSRDVIAMATAVSLSHDVYDAVMCLGVCDKIVPGMLIGVLQFGHLPVVFVPAGPMPSGIPNKQKALMRQKFAAGEIDKQELLKTESQSYHSAGTCTFYGTANTNQALVEALGVQLAGASFVNPGTPLRQALTENAVERVLGHTQSAKQYRPIAEVINEKSLVNAMVMMMATGGSTNLALHLVAIAAAAGIEINWQDMDQISRLTPLLARVYPNGQADVNHFHQAGGLAYVTSQLRQLELLNEDVVTIMGEGLDAYSRKPELDETGLNWETEVTQSGDSDILSSASKPFAAEGGMRLLKGSLGTAMVKISAVNAKYHIIEAPCKVFDTQDALKEAFERGDLECDFVAVVRNQGPSANGMPELHKLTPYLGVLQDKGHRVALLTDGRMSGASGKVLAAIHLSPEAKKGGLIAKLEDGDVVRIDAEAGELTLIGEEALVSARDVSPSSQTKNTLGRGLFENFRGQVSDASHGGSALRHHWFDA